MHVLRTIGLGAFAAWPVIFPQMQGGRTAVIAAEAERPTAFAEMVQRVRSAVIRG